MSALAKSAVSLYPLPTTPTASAPAERFPNTNDKVYLERRLKLVLTGQGGATNTIGAAALGFDQILSASNLWDATNSKGYPAVVDPVNNVLILVDGAAVPAPVDVTTTAAYITVTGTVQAPSAS